MAVTDTVPVTIPHWNPVTREWGRLTVDAPAEPRRRTRGRRTRKPGEPARRGAPRDLAGLSDGPPIEPWWRDTAFGDAGPLADLRTFIPPATIKTHRAPVVAFAAEGTGAGTRWFDL